MLSLLLLNVARNTPRPPPEVTQRAHNPSVLLNAPPAPEASLTWTSGMEHYGPLCFFTKDLHKRLPREVRDLVYEAVLDDKLQEQLATDIEQFIASPKRSRFKPKTRVMRYWRYTSGYTRTMMERGVLFPPVITELLERFYATHQKLCVESPASITDYLSLDIFGYGVTPADVALPMLKVNIDALPVTKHDDLPDNFAPLFDKIQRWGKASGRNRFCVQLNLNLRGPFCKKDYLRETYNIVQALEGVIKEVEGRGGCVDIYAWKWNEKISFNLREHMDSKDDWENGIQC